MGRTSNYRTERIGQGLLTKSIQWLFACVLAAGAAYAEPRVSGGYLPIVWSIAIAGAVAMGALPPVVKKLAKLSTPRWLVALASVILVLLWVLFAAPTIIVIGSILLTGRTM